MRKLLMAALCLSLLSVAPSYAQQTSCKASKESYDRLANGMSVREAVEIIGCEGSELSSSEIGGIKTVMLAWEGKGMLGASMNALFQGDAMVMKAQFGLE